MHNLEEYKTMLCSLHCNKVKGQVAPHKALLLLSLMELIAENVIPNTNIRISRELQQRFNDLWRKHIRQYTGFQCNVRIPFEHMGTEPFWKKHSVSEGEIEESFYYYCKDSSSCQEFSRILISSYLEQYHSECRIDFSELDPYVDKTLRTYQIDNKRAIYQMWQTHKSVMLQMPTGTGKTRLFVSIVRDLFDWGVSKKMAVKVLILAHRVELIDQIDTHLGMKYGLAHGLIMSSNIEQKKYPLQIGSVPTLVRRLDHWNDKNFDVVIIDEAHHVKADSYKKILETFPKAKVLGVTATPYRLNGAGFSPEFDELITSPSVSQFIKDGWLSNYTYYSIKPHSRIQKDIDSITKFALDGDYLDSAMAAIMDKDEIRAGIVDTYERFAKGKKGIVYTINRAHNSHICTQFQSRGYNAIGIDAETPPEIRAEAVRKFVRGKVDILCNVNIFSEGFDCPDVEFIQLARPTKSLSLYLQQVGRGLRMAKGKDNLIILDNVGIYNRFGFPSATRKWRHHFEGKDVDYTQELHGEVGEHAHFFDTELFAEGSEDVKLLHNSTSEILMLNKDEIKPDSNMYMYENQFRDYLQKLGRDPHTVGSYIADIKNLIDPAIKKYIDEKACSLLDENDSEIVDMYLQTVKDNPVLSQLNKDKHNHISAPLGRYAKFLEWMRNPSLQFEEKAVKATIDKSPSSKRSEEEVKSEIAVLKKYGVEIPKKLLDELRSIEQDKFKESLPFKLRPIFNGYPKSLELVVIYDAQTGSVSIIDNDKGAVDETNSRTRTNLRVTFADGTVICASTAKNTFVEVVKKIGYVRVKELNLSYVGLPMFTTELCENKAYASSQVLMDDNTYMYTCSGTEYKKNKLREIFDLLDIDATIEIV